MEDYTLQNGGCQFNAKGCCRNSAHMLPVTDWLCDLPENIQENDLVEVQFKNTRKGYYHNNAGLPLEKGVKVAVEANPGHDIGEVTLTGALVSKQMKKYKIDLERYEVRTIYRIATEQDLRRAEEAHAKEQETMIKARALAKSLGLEMKVGDVEYQGDGSKAIFYYIADGRVDFRQLIKVYAETFRVRIEMKQIGARQEAGRIGGTGPCGRELCCSTWMTNFHSVGTGAARMQNISPNPQKLAGQCAKLKCCLNYEIEVYEDALSLMPDRHTTLETMDGTWYCFSMDPLAGEITYSSDPKKAANLQILTPTQAKEIIRLNEEGKKPQTLAGKSTTLEAVESLGYQNVVGQDDLTRFDKRKKQRSSGVQEFRSSDNSIRSKEAKGNETHKKHHNGNRPRGGERPRGSM